MRRSAKAIITGLVCVAAAVASVPARSTAQAPDNSPIPRTREGKPGLQGLWQALTPAAFNIEPHPAMEGVPAGTGIVDGGEIPYLPPALAKRQENFQNRLTADPLRQCFLPGVPRVMYLPFPIQIVQTPTQIAMISEYVSATRSIYIDRPHPYEEAQFWMGDSRGRWEGDTLVVDVKNFTDQTWLDAAGNFHSENLHVVERFSLRGPNHIMYEARLEDPKVFSKPWTIRLPLYRRLEQDVELLEYDCYGSPYLEERLRFLNRAPRN